VGRGRRLPQAEIDVAVVEQVSRDLLSPAFVSELLRETRQISAPPADENLARLRGEISSITTKLSKLAELAADTDTPRPFLERINELEPKRERLKGELAQLEAEYESSRALESLTEEDVSKLLQGLASHLTEADQEAVKELLEGIIERIELDPDSHQCRIHYRIDTGEMMASPRGFEPFPAFTTSTRVKIPHNRRRTVPQ
jgi:DNA repair exonuclease SbcCD ATPase subunit